MLGSRPGVPHFNPHLPWQQARTHSASLTIAGFLFLSQIQREPAHLVMHALCTAALRRR
jgi:hypothetical protein